MSTFIQPGWDKSLPRLGWTEFDGEPAYAYGRRMIGAQRVMTAEQPYLAGLGLGVYVGADPPEGEELKAAVRSAVDVVRWMPFPLSGGVYLAPLTSKRLVLHVTGGCGHPAHSFDGILAEMALWHWVSDGDSIGFPSEMWGDELGSVLAATSHTVAMFNGVPDDLHRYAASAPGVIVCQNDSGIEPCLLRDPSFIEVSLDEWSQRVPHTVENFAKYPFPGNPKYSAQAMAGFIRFLLDDTSGWKECFLEMSLLMSREIPADLLEAKRISRGPFGEMAAALSLFLFYACEVGAITERERDDIVAAHFDYLPERRALEPQTGERA